MTAATQNQWLPPLPEPDAYRHRYEKGPAWSYTAEQMHAYALEAIRVYSEANAQPLKERICTQASTEEAARMLASAS